MTVSPWLSAISALDRRLTSSNMTLAQYRGLSYVLEYKNADKNDLAEFISHYEDQAGGHKVITSLLELGLIALDEENEEKVVLSEFGNIVSGEVYNLCQSRLTSPLFVKPNF